MSYLKFFRIQNKRVMRSFNLKCNQQICQQPFLLCSASKQQICATTVKYNYIVWQCMQAANLCDLFITKCKQAANSSGQQIYYCSREMISNNSSTSPYPLIAVHWVIKHLPSQLVLNCSGIACSKNSSSSPGMSTFSSQDLVMINWAEVEALLR